MAKIFVNARVSNSMMHSSIKKEPQTSKKTGVKSSVEGAKKSDEKAVVPRKKGMLVASQQNQSGTMRAIVPSKNYDVVSFGRAMNTDFGQRVKNLFDPETEAALAAQETGVYVGWRCAEYNWDCQRVGKSSRCFCGHTLNEHSKYDGQSVRVPCAVHGCSCKAFAWIASRPEEVGEFWLAKRPGFDRSSWRVMCRCKHSHQQHNPNYSHQCQSCGCSKFSSSSVCAACDRHWEEHETFFDTERSRQQKGLPIGDDYIPFAEIPSLRNMVLTGEDDEDMSYMRIQRAPTDALPHPSDSKNRGAVSLANRYTT